MENLIGAEAAAPPPADLINSRIYLETAALCTRATWPGSGQTEFCVLLLLTDIEFFIYYALHNYDFLFFSLEN